MPTYEQPPAEITHLSPDQLAARIAAAKARLAGDLVILGHHYQADDVIQFADFTGDSLRLAQLAADQKQARAIVFCGVHFMAESADILSGPDQAVCLPNLKAGCSMAEMADDQAVLAAMDELAEISGESILPVTYVNSSAAVKAVTGRAGGACCTSGNVANVFRWALQDRDEGGAGAKRILAIPDRHLGLNTAVALGYSGDDCAVYDPALPTGGLTAEQVRRATFLLWKGHCYVHQFFRSADVEAVRRDDPTSRVIVHPECPREVVELADAVGSTEQIIRAIEAGGPASRWAVGTEGALVARLARQWPDRHIRLLCQAPAVCVQMKQIDTPHLLWVLEGLIEGRFINRIQVPPPVADDARIALDRMLAIRRVEQATRAKEEG